MYSLIRSLLFRIDPEAAHEIASEQMERLQQIALVLRLIERACAPPPEARRELFGLTFPSPIGLAAGFDKNAVMMPFLAALGFGFLEVGTVTLEPQAGNARPRLFRDPAAKALVNRMGFNNDGADAVAERLRARPQSLPVFVNIGKNRDVPLEAAPEAYARCYERVASHADAVVINVSSPNTPSLRELQRPDHLSKIIDTVKASRPLLVKIAPDVDDGLLREICDLCVRRASGMICTNTSAHPEGGLSGAPLMEKSTRVLARVREHVGAEYPLIGVGGIFTGDDLRRKLDAGADLVQLYTSLIYEGPALPSRLARELVHRSNR